MPDWPDEDGALIIEFVNQLNLARDGGSYQFYRSLLQRFQGFVTRRAATMVLRSGYPRVVEARVENIAASPSCPLCPRREPVPRLVSRARCDQQPTRLQNCGASMSAARRRPYCGR